MNHKGKMKFVRQYDAMDCGPACLTMIVGFYGKNYSLQFLRENSYLTKEGVSLLGISRAAQKIGLETFSAKLTLDQLESSAASKPCILYWNQNHFIVLLSVDSRKKRRKWKIADPRVGFVTLGDDALLSAWLVDGNEGIAMFVEATDSFLSTPVPKKDSNRSLYFLIKSIKDYKKEAYTLLSLMFFGSLLTLIFPFLTQNLIDKGVNAKNITYIQTVLLAQMTVFASSMIIDFFRTWVMLKLGAKLSSKIISEFLAKMLRLPIKFFDSKMTSDYNQRIQDNERIENFLTSQSLITFFSLITFLIFFIVLWYYNYKILLIYFILTSLAILWACSFLKKRKVLDYYKFQQLSVNQQSILEILGGVAEMKLNNFIDFKLREWRENHRKLYIVNMKFLKLNQFEYTGFEFINQLKNILVTFFAAKCVIDGTLTLGALLSISYIIGQMNFPINQLMTFFRSFQEARLSLDRLDEVNDYEVEDSDGQLVFDRSQKENSNQNEKGIVLSNVSFQYDSSYTNHVLNNVSFFIPEGKVTAIVGASGSGKTTLIKLLLKFYAPTKGQILLNTESLVNISSQSLRDNCGVVMQDGFIFSDTIERNIATGEETVDYIKLENAIRIANIGDFIDSLPLGLETQIGSSGNGLSGGQKQRLLIARAVYKNPHFIMLDEATSALDAENEKIIHNNLQDFFKGKTVIIVAHRLSTVRNADQVVVLKNGEVVEIGHHEQLTTNKSEYFNLIKNQLELGT
jgi:ATP-binding cassette subfamily B protein